MKIIDRYIIGKFLGTFVFAILLLTALAIIIDLTEKVDDLIEHQVPASVVIFSYYVNFVPYIVALLSPLIIFISLVFFTSRMAYNSELIAIISSGMSFYRLLVPYFVAAAMLAAMLLVANHFIVPMANKGRLAFENAYIRSPFRNTDRNIHIQLSDEVYAYMENYNVKDSTGYKFALEKIVNGELTYKLRAERIEWQADIRKWRIKNRNNKISNTI